MVRIHQTTIADISTFYANTMLCYPNTWTKELVNEYIEKTIKEMECIVLSTIQGQRTPILQQLNDGKTAELFTSDRKWYFSVKMIDSDVIIENAWYATNASNRAYRRGRQTPNANTSLDDRCNQGKVGFLPSKQRNTSRTTILKGTYYGGLKVGYNNYKYIILKSDNTPFLNKWFDAMPKFYNSPCGRLNTIALVNENGYLCALTTDGKLYAMNKSWHDAFTESKHLDTIIRRIIKEELYRCVEPHPFIIRDNKRKTTPILSLKEKNGYSHVIEDDGCYVLYNGNDDTGYGPSTHWTPEEFNAMKKLPNLPRR